MFNQRTNYVCRVFNPLKEKGNEDKFKFEICFRSDLVFTDGKLYNSIVECTKSLCDFIIKISEYDENKFTKPIILKDFSYVNETL